MSGKYTPGPWHLEAREMLEVRSDTEKVCELSANESTTPERFAANANLMAAAPQLLEALLGAYRSRECGHPDCAKEWQELAREAFKRAGVES